MRTSKGFTLMEILVALSILAIALTALLKGSSQAVVNSSRIKDKMFRHWVAMQAVYMIQLGLEPIKEDQVLSQKTSLFRDSWYWRASLSPTMVKSVFKITVKTSHQADGPFEDPLIAFKYDSSS